ncbi:hypothetical protein LCGC14_2208740, partial [marine sediment metagenome]
MVGDALWRQVMTNKQEKIREGTASRIEYECGGCLIACVDSTKHPCYQQYNDADNILRFQRDMGVVIIDRDRELPSVFNT